MRSIRLTTALSPVWFGVELSITQVSWNCCVCETRTKTTKKEEEETEFRRELGMGKMGILVLEI